MDLATATPCTLARGQVRILVGDCRARLRELPDRSVHCVVTSPPYWGLRDYGIEPGIWDGDPACAHEWGETGPAHHPGQVADGKAVHIENARGQNAGSGRFCLRCNAWRGCHGLEPTVDLYVRHECEIFREVRRVLRDDGTVWLVLGDSFAGSWGNYGARKGGQRKRNTARFRRPAYEQPEQGWRGLPPAAQVAGLKPKDLVGIPWRVAFALRDDGWWLRSDIVWAKKNPMPESVRDRPTRAHEFLFMLAKSEGYFFDADAVREPFAAATMKRLAQATFDLQTGGPKDGLNPNRSARRALVNLKGRALPPQVEDRPHRTPGRNIRSVWHLATQPFKGAHFATFPEALVEPCVLAGTSARGCCPHCGAPWVRVTERRRNRDGTPVSGGWNGGREQRVGPQGAGHWRFRTDVDTLGWRASCGCTPAEPVPTTVLDPFAGAGTTAIVAGQHGRNAILIELNPAYAAMARERLAAAGMDATIA